MALEDKIVKKYLYEWFLDHDSLVIPDLGRFEATYSGATIQPTIYKFLPPNKKITFNSAVTEDDSVLADLIVEREGFSENQAVYTIASFVSKVKSELNTQQRYIFEGFGTLVQTPEGNILFRTDEEANLSGDSFGLPNLYSKPINRPMEELQEDFTSFKPNPLTDTNPELVDFGNEFKPINTGTLNYKDGDDVIIEEEKINRNTRRLVAVLLTVLLLVSAVFVIFLITDTNPFWTSDKKANATPQEEKNNVEIPVPDAQEQEEDQNRRENKPKSDNNSPQPTPGSTSKFSIEHPPIDYPTNDEFIKKFKYTPIAPSDMPSIMVRKASGKYYVVLGSFGKTDNAYSFYNNLRAQGISTAKIVAPGGENDKYRVCYGVFDTKADAIRQGKMYGKRKAVEFLVMTY